MRLYRLRRILFSVMVPLKRPTFRSSADAGHMLQETSTDVAIIVTSTDVAIIVFISQSMLHETTC